ncbi:hypothetical protein LSAT2_030922 [Lamellibrachia satsuma]|nr:hypothetical protein LSAT2_030922 [Lamellibrachia satsuma]
METITGVLNTEGEAITRHSGDGFSACLLVVGTIFGVMGFLLIAGFVWRMKKRREKEIVRCETFGKDPDDATSPCLPSSPGRPSSSRRSSSSSDITSSEDTDDDEGDDGDVEAGRPNKSSSRTTMAGRFRRAWGHLWHRQEKKTSGDRRWRNVLTDVIMGMIFFF